MALTGVGYVDGKLHLQTAVTDPEAHDNHGYFSLLDREGNRIQIGKYLYFRLDGEDDEQPQRQEHVFDVSPEMLSSCHLYGWFQIGGELIRGDRRDTFPIENTAE